MSLRIVLALAASIAIWTAAMAALVIMTFAAGPPRWLYTLETALVPMSILYLVGGLPAHLVLRRSGRHRARHYAAAGAAIGLALDILVQLRTFSLAWGGLPSILNVLSLAGISVGTGVACALTFWILGVWSPWRPGQS